MTTAIYARESTGSEEQRNALEQQLARLRAAAKQSGAEDPAEYIDIESGTSDGREHYLRLMADCKAGLISEVIVTALDRLSRSRRGHAELIEFFKQGAAPNLRILDLKIDLSTPEGCAMAGIVGVMATQEVEMLSKRVRHGHAHRRALRKPSGPLAPFGYRFTEDRCRLEPDPEQWPIAKQIIAKFEECRQWRTVVNWLNEEMKVPQFGNAFGLKRWMLNPTLAGARCYGTREEVLNPKTGKAEFKQRPLGEYGEVYWEDDDGNPFQEPLISQVQLALYKALADENSTPETRQHAEGTGGARILTGLITCTDCGKKLQHHRAGKNKAGASPLKLRCTTVNCPSRYKTVDADGVIYRLQWLLMERSYSVAKELETFKRAQEDKISNEEQSLREEIKELEAKTEVDPDYAPILEVKRQRLNQLVSSGSADALDLEQFVRRREGLAALVMSGRLPEIPELLRPLFQRYYSRAEASMGRVTKVIFSPSIRKPGTDGAISLDGQGVGKTWELMMIDTCNHYWGELHLGMVSPQTLFHLQEEIIALSINRKQDAEKMPALLAALKKLEPLLFPHAPRPGSMFSSGEDQRRARKGFGQPEPEPEPDPEEIDCPLYEIRAPNGSVAMVPGVRQPDGSITLAPPQLTTEDNIDWLTQGGTYDPLEDWMRFLGHPQGAPINPA